MLLKYLKNTFAGGQFSLWFSTLEIIKGHRNTLKINIANQ